MADLRLTQREQTSARNADRRREMDAAIAEGRLVVRQMTADERAASDAGSVERDAARQRTRRSRNHYLM